MSRMPDTEALPDIQSMWDYDDPAAAEDRFRAVLPRAEATNANEYRAELLTQIARTYSMRRRFDEAHELLDQVAIMLEEERMPRARVRYLLELGRTCNSSGSPEKAKKLFLAAWESAGEAKLDGLAVDAAHMIAIVEPPDAALKWNQRALNLAFASSDPDARRWKGSLCNNIGWTYHEKSDYETALGYFEKALAHRLEQGKTSDIRIARWCVARCYRSLGRVEDALAIQRELESEHAAAGTSDGYVNEEIAECLLALGHEDESKPYYRRAYEQLSQDAWLTEHEADRLERLQQLAESK